MMKNIVLLIVLGSGGLAAHGVEAAEKPNIVVILAADQGWGDLSVHGNTNLAAVNIDSLAKDGALFERFFVCPPCSPTRAESLTGRYHPRGAKDDRVGRGSESYVKDFKEMRLGKLELEKGARIACVSRTRSCQQTRDGYPICDSDTVGRKPCGLENNAAADSAEASGW